MLLLGFDSYIYTNVFLSCTSYFAVFLHENAFSHCSLFINNIYDNMLILIPGIYDVCQCSLFSKLHEHACPCWFSCWIVCIQTNYGDVVKFIAVSSFMCVNFFVSTWKIFM